MVREYRNKRAFFKLLYLAGALYSNHLNLGDLWSNNGFCPKYYRAIIVKIQFHILLESLKFYDQKGT